LEVTKDMIRVAAGTGTVLIQELQPASGKRVTMKQYRAGHDVKVGARLSSEPPYPIDSKEGDGL
jgi:methionyl-tRNA formyltransferase